MRITYVDVLLEQDADLNSQKEMGQAYRDVIGRNFPAMSVVQVVKLVEERALVEIEAIARKG